MTTTDTSTVLISVFPDSRRAERFVEALKRAGFRNEQIGILARSAETGETQAEEGATAGMLTGGVWGALLGAAIATGLIPGVGPVIAGGLLAGLLGGAAIGVTAGGVLGGLIGMGIPEDEARRYESEFMSGRTLVVVKGEGRLAEAAAILRHLKAETSPAAEPSLEKPDVERLDERP